MKRDKRKCSVCKGTGREVLEKIRSDGEKISESIMCEACKGSGYVNEYEYEYEYNRYDEHRDVLCTYFNHEFWDD